MTSKTELRCRQCGYQLVVRRDPPACPSCRAWVWEPVGSHAAPHSLPTASRARADATADWDAVEELLAGLFASATRFDTATSTGNWISTYEPARRLRLETDIGSSWVQIDCIKDCWLTLERLGRIRRRDVLEPGRCSAFIMALFQQVTGVRQELDGEEYLVLRGKRAAKRPAAH